MHSYQPRYWQEHSSLSDVSWKGRSSRMGVAHISRSRPYLFVLLLLLLSWAHILTMISRLFSTNLFIHGKKAKQWLVIDCDWLVPVVDTDNRYPLTICYCTQFSQLFVNISSLTHMFLSNFEWLLQLKPRILRYISNISFN